MAEGGGFMGGMLGGGSSLGYYGEMDPVILQLGSQMKAQVETW